ncbi:MAG: hypothetical protein ACI8YQ_002857 [Polaribacter sp.]|jgi:hypothetical protein
MTTTKINKFLSTLFFMAVIAVLSLNCHTSKNHDNGEHKDKDGKEHVKDAKEQNTDLAKHKLGETLQITNGDYVSIASESLQIKIQAITEDSRCPLNTNCIQAGKAKLELMVIKELDMVSSVNLIAKGGCQKMDGSCGNSAIAQGYKFTLIALTPYPGEDGKNSVPKDKYVAHVKVEAVK